jgi:hypothetical protein
MGAKASLCVAALLVSLVSGCAFMQKDNRRILNALDKSVENTWVTETTAGQIAAAPPFMLVGGLATVVDAVLVQPVVAAPPAAHDMFDALWKDPQGSAFQQMMLFPLKVAASPIVFVSDWAFRSAICTDPGKLGK